MSTDSATPGKDALCHACAVRMSILFKYPIPRTAAQVVEACGHHHHHHHPPSSPGETGLPVLDTSFHPHFIIVHETAESAARYFDAKRYVSSSSSSSSSSHNSARAGGGWDNAAEESNSLTANGWPSNKDEPRYDVSWLCVACMGLYQFMDHVHAPMAAAAVRTSPYFDSAAVSVNVNVSRGFSFTWLAAAVRYFDNEGRDGTTAEAGRGPAKRPDRAQIVPEELSNFKEFYMSDLRARVLYYLLPPHEEVLAKGAQQLVGLATYTRAIAEGWQREINERKQKKDLDAYHALVRGHHPHHEQEEEEGGGPEKKRKVEAAEAPTRAVGCAQSLKYNASNESIVEDIFCRHLPTETLITSEEKYLPATYCTNRTDVVVNFGVIYDYVEPYLEGVGWGPLQQPPAARREAAVVQCVVTHANINIMGNYCKLSRSLSQSPWFSNGGRVGSASLQEVIARPVLPFFFPDGVTSVLPAGNVASSQQQQHHQQLQQQRAAAGAGGGDGAPAQNYRQGLARIPPNHATPWQDIDPQVVAYGQVYGYGRYKFHTAGREDVDVRMLGAGRPFVLELVSPTREKYTPADLTALAAAINASEGGCVAVTQLRPTDANVTVRLARHSESKVKRYRAVVWCSRAITDPATDPHFAAANRVKDLEIEQKTPLRVLHRRSLHPRPRTIHSLRLTPINAHWFLLDLETQAGTYVKEFVHGDMGRTVPNLGMLLNGRADIIQLDVVDMAMQDLDS